MQGIKCIHFYPKQAVVERVNQGGFVVKKNFKTIILFDNNTQVYI